VSIYSSDAGRRDKGFIVMIEKHLNMFWLSRVFLIEKGRESHDKCGEQSLEEIMKTHLLLIASIFLLANAVSAAPPALTIYNDGFAIVRDTVPLDLKSRVNDVRFTGATAPLEPDSVILRDPKGKHSFQILEQNYRNEPVSQELLLSLFEGKEIWFQINGTGDQPARLVRGKIIRSRERDFVVFTVLFNTAAIWLIGHRQNWTCSRHIDKLPLVIVFCIA